MNEPIEKIDMLVIDNSAIEFPDDLNNFFDNTTIIKGIRKDQWSCKYSCGLDVCDLINNNKHTHIDKRISIRILFKRWLEFFLEDYNKIKYK
ncbi:hypothetical protein K1I93_09420, partial [Streptococcus australis]|uniref:hypothetical protein n=1 Tax=Streptococcus australis TaxID=113107 RepID=UPI001CBC3CE6